MLDRVVAQPYDAPRSSTTLAEEYAKRGMPYTPEDARAVRQVRVRFLRDRAAPPAAAAAAVAGGAGDDEDDNGKARDSYQRDGIYASDRVYRVQVKSTLITSDSHREQPGS